MDQKINEELLETINTVLSHQQKETSKTNRFNRIFKGSIIVYLIFGAIFFSSYKPSLDSETETDPHIAVINIVGDISHDHNTNNSDRISKLLKQVMDNGAAKALFLKINSPGGSPVQADQIFREITHFKEESGIPVYAFIEDIGASAAYYVAVSADKIFADTNSLVGSIGVIGGGFGFADVMNKVGVERRAYTSGLHKTFLDPFSPENKDEVLHMNTILKTTHNNFINRVKEGRGDRLKQDANLFEGLVWSGNTAVELGLIDGIFSTREFARNELENIPLVTISPSRNFFSGIAKYLGAEFAEGAIEASISKTALELQ